MNITGDNNTRLTTAESDIDNLEGRMTTAEGDIIALDTRIDGLENAESDRNEPHGFVDRSCSMAMNGNNFEITGTITFYYKGTKYSKVNDSVSISMTDSDLIVFVYYVGNVLTASTTVWDIMEHVMVAYILRVYPAYTYRIADERHGIVMDRKTHDYLHKTRGSIYYNGGLLGGYTLNNDSGTVYTVSECQFYDEDLLNVCYALGVSDSVSKIFRDNGGSVSGWAESVGTDRIYKLEDDIIRYNLYEIGTWSAVNVTNNYYVNYYLFATNVENRFYIIMGQSQYSNSSGAANENVNSLDLNGLPFEEIVPVAKITYQYKSSYTAPGKARIVNVQTIFNESILVTASVTSHNGLNDLQGGDVGQYYHLNNSKYDDVNNLDFTKLQNISGSVLDTSTTFTGNVLASNVSSTNKTDIEALQLKTYNITGNVGGETFISGNLNFTYFPNLTSTTVGERPYYGVVKQSGVMDIGQHLDFHRNTDTTSDYGARLTVETDGQLTATGKFLAVGGLEMDSGGTLGTYVMQYIANQFFPVGTRILRITNTAPPNPPYIGTWALWDVVETVTGLDQYIWQRTA